MTAIATTIQKENSCPDVIVNNTTEYPSNSSHSRSNFKEYVKYSLLLPNGFTVTFSPTQYPNQVLPPAQDLSILFQTCLTGLFVANYIALPTPPEEVVVGQSNEYTTGDNFYYDGVIYSVSAASIGIPADGFTNSQLIAAFLSANAISVIDESDIASKYKDEIEFTSWCTLDTCLESKLEKLCCLIVAEPTRNDLCEMELYKQVLQLNFLKYVIDNTPFEEPITESGLYWIKSASNYINSICCCKDCKDC